MKRMKWIRDGTIQRSSCGRFILRRVCLNPKFQGYKGLTDTLTGEEFPCRTDESAKAAARNRVKMISRCARCSQLFSPGESGEDRCPDCVRQNIADCNFQRMAFAGEWK